jgi:hypothetical protein
MYCQLLVSENIFLKYVFEYLEIELEKIIKIGIDNTVHSRESGNPGEKKNIDSRLKISGMTVSNLDPQSSWG